MILGIGVDLVEVRRLEKALNRWGERFAGRVFTCDERRFCAGRARVAECLAARFAAKEAFFKALGTGISRGMKWTDVEVLRDEAGAPHILLKSKADESAQERGMRRLWLSLTHQGGFSMAAVVIEG